MKRKTKIVSLVAVIGLLLGVVAGITPVRAGTPTNVSDTMGRLQVSIADVTHTIKFTPATAINQDDGVQITIPTAFDDASLDVNDYSISQGTGGTPCASWTENAYVPANDKMQFECDTVGANGTGEITVSITVDLDNPSSVGEYEFKIETYDLGADGNFGGGDDVLEDLGYLSVSIVDDDTVNITGYIDTILTFDIDTSEINEDCDAAGGANPCDSHGGTTDNAGYVADLGELTLTDVNDSGDNVLHADGLTGEINYIWFNLDTNADNGAAVTVLSANGALYKDATNSIPSVVNDGDGVPISPGDGRYGIREESNSATQGSFTIAGDYNGAPGVYGEATTTSTQIFNTTGNPVVGGRVQFEVGATPDGADAVGTYTDTLTFIATATF